MHGTPSLARGIQVTPRLPDFRFDDALGEAWFAGDAALTAFWNALGVIAGAGESAFIDAGRGLLAHIDDPFVAEETRAYVQQEAFHAAVHARMNRVLATRGLPVEALRDLVDTLFTGIEAHAGRSVFLSAALAGEQAIGEFGHAILATPAIMAEAEEGPRRLWMWHWFEEVEHQAALHDGWAHVHGVGPEARGLRVLGAAYTVVLLAIVLPAGTWRMAASLGSARWRPSTWRSLWRQLLGPDGLFRGTGRNLLELRRVDFHPFDVHDPAPTLARWRGEITSPDWERPVSRAAVPEAPPAVEVRRVGWRDGVGLVRYAVAAAWTGWRFARG